MISGTDRAIKNETVLNRGNLYSYELTARESGKITLYSIKITLKTAFGEITERVAENIFDNEEDAVAFYEMLIKNLATPLNLPYIVEDELR